MRVGMAKAARRELAAAIEHYDREVTGLGDEFLNEFANAVTRIQQWPNAFARVSARARRCSLRRFPYGVVYQVREDFIRIVAVMHLARKPDYWRDRE